MEDFLISIIRRLQPQFFKLELDEDIVCAHSDMGIRDERTEMNEPLVYRLWYQLKCRVAMFGTDKR